LKALCPECDAGRDEQRRRCEAARTAGFSGGWSSTPEAHRLSRERTAAKEGRVLEPYIPQAERNRRGRMLDAERLAHRIRSLWVSEWLRPFREQLQNDLYWTDAAHRKAKKSWWRNEYAKHREREVARVVAYKRANPDRNNQWTQIRLERERDAADGTVTRDAIARLKYGATNCAYCGCALKEKQTDHMIPLVLGGEHSMRNIAIVCSECNGRKARLSYEEWLDRVDAQHRERVLALYYERYGEPGHGAVAA
jgi:5-methylcytosine-specific restriction endonuclease McrA